VTDLVLIYESVTSSASDVAWLTLHSWSLNSLMTDLWLSLSLMLRPTVIGIKHPSGAYDQIFITVGLLRICWCGALSLTRGRVCRLQLLLAVASAVILGSESLGTRGRILLSQIWDFSFRRLLRLAGSRWRHSTPPPHMFFRPYSARHSSFSWNLRHNIHSLKTAVKQHELLLQTFTHKNTFKLISLSVREIQGNS
jgi:hypothetical protein